MDVAESPERNGCRRHPKPDAPLEIRGQFKPISTRVPGIHICEHFPQLAQRTDKLAIVRSMTHTNVDHLTSTSYLLTGHAPPTDGQLRSDCRGCENRGRFRHRVVSGKDARSRKRIVSGSGAMVTVGTTTWVRNGRLQ